MSVDWKKLIPAAVTAIGLVVVFVVAKYAPADLAAVTALVEQLQPLFIAILAAVTVNSVAGSVASVARARVEAEAAAAVAITQAGAADGDNSP